MKRILTILILTAVCMTGHAQKQQQRSKTALQLERQGYVNVQDADPSIQVSLMYGRADNFCGEILYGDLREAYLHPEAAEALKKAQQYLKKHHPELSLKVYDAARPMHIQQKMWAKVKNTDHDFYVSNPANGGGLHNYGLAVDITLCNQNGDTLAMGTKVDHMSKLSHIDKEDELVAKKLLSRKAIDNRKILREAMAAGGFKPLRTEWWHFNLRTRAEAKQRYKVIR